MQEHQNTKTLLHSLLFLPVTMPTYRPHYYKSCQTYLRPLFGSICQRCKERERIPWADQTHDRCSTYKRIRPAADFPLHRNSRTSSCAAYLARLRDVYCEQKGEPVS
jgi:hypothetical protein